VKTQNDITKGIQILKEASGCLKEVSGYYKQVSGCLHLPDPETSKNRDAAKLNFNILYYIIPKNLGKTSPN